MRAVDVFSGAGGMSVGAFAAGIKPTIAIESDPYAAATYSRNHPNSTVLCDDIRSIDFLPFRSNEETLLFGGPPCQGFSTSNQRTRNSDNQNNWLFKEFLRAAEQLEPDWVVFENVKGIAETENAKFLNFVIQGLENLGYSTKSSVLNAADFGVPQSRSRQFVVAAHNLCGFNFPQPRATLATTVRDAISDLPKLDNGASTDVCKYLSKAKSKYARAVRAGKRTVSGNLVTRNAMHVVERYDYIPEGGNWENIPSYLMANYKDASRCHSGIYRRLEWDSPSVTIGNYRKNMLIHPEGNRGLSVREAARLQSFPDHFVFCGSIGFQQQQVGNAVPPLLAKALFEEILAVSSSSRQTMIAAE